MSVAKNLTLEGISLQFCNATHQINYCYYCYKHHNFCILFLHIVVKEQTLRTEIYLSQMSSWHLLPPPPPLSLSVGHLRERQISLVRTTTLSSSCYHLPSEYGTRSGERSDMKKGAVSLTEHSPFSKHNNDILTDVAAEIPWRTAYVVDGDTQSV